MPSRFWDLMEQSVLTSGVISVLLISSVCWLAVKGDPIPDLLTVATSVILGFFFGAKVEASARRMAH